MRVAKRAARENKSVQAYENREFVTEATNTLRKKWLKRPRGEVQVEGEIDRAR
jgi:hypothetical protein